MQSENPVRTYLDSEHHAWVTEEAKRRRCSIAQVLRDLVAQAASEHSTPEPPVALTPKHKVLTESGWKAVSELSEGELVGCADSGEKVVFLHPAALEHLKG